ncbi:RDD family protein [Geoalkalibacter sp.]|uniref:RDD family protein n=1 Tax=Geoalkalibacter sp. TaxID=3041440 RepID=UPI00272EE74A|nr:RDD family protein [Geoalkalibacter sp.]
MKCPKCGFNSFDYLESCKKCGNDLKEFKGRFSLRSLLFPHRDKAPPLVAVNRVMARAEEAEFDYGFMEQQAQDPVPASAAATVAAAAVAPVEEAFDIDWNQDDAGASAPEEASAPPAAAVSMVSGDSAFALDTDAELEDLLFDEASSPVAEAGALADSPAEDAWDEEALADLSVGEDLPAFEGLEEGLPALASTDVAQIEEVELPSFDELDFAGVDLDDEPPVGDGDAEPSAWGDIDFAEQDKPSTRKAEATKEAPADPFEQPEPVAAGQAPEDIAATADQAAEEDVTEGQAAVAAPLPASLVARLGAFWLDLFLVVGAFLLFLIIGTRLLAPPGVSALLPSLYELIRLSLPYYLLFFLVCFGYFTAFHLFFGQTPGKMLFGLRLEGSAGRELAPSEAFLHSVGGLACLLSLGIGFFLALRHPEGRGWNDRMAGTRLVAVPEDEQP